MPLSQRNQRFFASTRGQIITLLRRSSRTVEELAQALNLTDNAVRAHLATLERDGVVQQRGVRRGSGKPASIYDLAPEAEQLFPKAYVPVLQQVLAILSERLPTDEVETLLREAGRRIATQWKVPSGELRVQLEAAPFDTMIEWLDTLDTRYGYALESITVDRGAAPGMVNASVTFTNPRH